MCLGAGNVPLLKNIRTALIDPDTPDSAKTITSANGKQWQLVVSLEFGWFYQNHNHHGFLVPCLYRISILVL